MARFHYAEGEYFARPGKDLNYVERTIFRGAGWTFHPTRKIWVTTDEKRAFAIIQYAAPQTRERMDNITALRQAAIAASWAEDTDEEFPCPEGKRYLPFQKAGIAYALDGDRTLIADPPGLGKTIQAIGVHNASKANRVLIVCPASLKINWAREWLAWDVHGMSVGIAKSTPKTKQVQGVKTSWTEYEWPETAVVIINYDMLETFDKQLKAIRWDMVVFDEAHMLKTADTIRTLHVFGGEIPAKRQGARLISPKKVVAPIRAARHLYLTGTPIMSKPVELWNFILACDPEGLGRSYLNYVHRYCDATETSFGLDTSGSSNLEELNEILRTRFMIRRDKKSVLKDLPDKIRELIMLPVDKLEKPVKKEKSRVEKALSDFEKMLGLSGEADDFRFITAIDQLSESLQAALDKQGKEEPDWNRAIRSLSEPERILFTELSEAREEVALAKVGLVVEHVKKLHECGEPVILFGYHKSVIEAIRERLVKAGLRVGVVTGDVSAAPRPDGTSKRQDVVDAFQSGKLDVIIGNILAMGVGFTLTRASFVVFAELDWVPALIEQAEDRAWRLGQKNAVTIQHLVVDGSIEARMVIRLLEKMGTIFAALDAIIA